MLPSDDQDHPPLPVSPTTTHPSKQHKKGKKIMQSAIGHDSSAIAAERTQRKGKAGGGGGGQQRLMCDCQAREHELVGNCLACGKIVCAQEGPGVCLFCGRYEVRGKGLVGKYITSGTSTGDGGGGAGEAPVAPGDADLYDGRSGEERDKIDKAIKLRDQIMEQGPWGGAVGMSVKHTTRRTWSVCLSLSLRLRVCPARNKSVLTKVYDDQSDWYSAANDPWLTREQRLKAIQKQKELEDRKRQENRNQHPPPHTHTHTFSPCVSAGRVNVNFDFAGRRITQADSTIEQDNKAALDAFDDEIRQPHASSANQRIKAVYEQLEEDRRLFMETLQSRMRAFNTGTWVEREGMEEEGGRKMRYGGVETRTNVEVSFYIE